VFIGSANDFAVFRAFKNSHCRILLELEIEITEIERELDELDIADDANPGMQYRLRGMLPHEIGWDTARLELMARLKEKLKEYGELNRVEVVMVHR
jgi:hypothetical protein